jgi:hypothetical protein
LFHASCTKKHHFTSRKGLNLNFIHAINFLKYIFSHYKNNEWFFNMFNSFLLLGKKIHSNNSYLHHLGSFKQNSYYQKRRWLNFKKIKHKSNLEFEQMVCQFEFTTFIWIFYHNFLQL